MLVGGSKCHCHRQATPTPELQPGTTVVVGEIGDTLRSGWLVVASTPPVPEQREETEWFNCSRCADNKKGPKGRVP